MKYYQDITIIPCAEISIYHIWEKLYQQVHLALVESQDAEDKIHIGVAFPKYQYNEKCKTLGNVLRVFANSEQKLENLDLTKWLTRLSDYAHIKSIRTVPETNSFYSFYDPRPESNIERLARRNIKRLKEKRNIKITLEEAIKNIKARGFKEEKLDYPFINVKSLGNQHRFRRFIIQRKADTMTNKGFNSYGLSRQSSLPNF